MQPFGLFQGIIYEVVIKLEQPIDYSALYDRYSNMVFRLAFLRTKNTADSEDILQDVFLKLLKNGHKIENEEHMKAWLIRVTINCSNSYLSSPDRKKTEQLGDKLYIDLKEKSDVYYAVMALPCKYRTVIHLFYYEGYSCAEIAKIIKKSGSAVKSRLSRARGMLSETLKGEDFDV